MAFAAVTGLAAEARIARRLGLRAVATGGRAERTADAAARLIAEGATGLLSFGICGGLDPALASGTLILPRAVQSETGERYLADAAAHRLCADALGGTLVTEDMLGAGSIVDTVARKAALFRRMAAVAIDNESHLVAAAATAAGIPFLVLRAVADPATRALPPAALIGLDDEGRPALLPVLRSLLVQPGQLGALLAIARDTSHALHALRRVAAIAPGIFSR
ncbi:MAG TPA: nucleoside phosphorylase [Stellaceae bacterium]|jgi:adenosylhomocysteine nucleosidase|nr:nucleoside phosphorylase [Stellaceae bacterium]